MTKRDATEAPHTRLLPESADSVRLELTVPESDGRSAAQALGMDPLDAHVRLVHLLDTPGLGLLEHGVVIRARRRRGRDDAMIAVHRATPRALPRAVRASAAYSLDIGGPYDESAYTASVRSWPGAGTIARVAAGEAPVRALFTPEQRALLRACAPAGAALGELTLFGPVVVLRPKYTPEAFGRRLVADLWMLPDGSRRLELFTRCAPQDAALAAAQTRAFLARYGVEPEAGAPPAAQRALELLAGHGGRAAAARPPGRPPGRRRSARARPR